MRLTYRVKTLSWLCLNQQGNVRTRMGTCWDSCRSGERDANCRAGRVDLRQQDAQSLGNTCHSEPVARLWLVSFHAVAL